MKREAMNPGERRTITANVDGYAVPKPIGFVYFTHGCFYRATALWSGLSYGPFESFEAAENWIRTLTVGVGR